MEQNNCLELHIYPDKTGSAAGTIYSDIGDGFGESRVDEFQCFRDGEGIIITQRTIGEYQFPYEGIAVFLHGHSAKYARLNGADIELKFA